MNLELLVGHPSGSRLVADYLTRRPSALAFFQGDPTLAASYTAAAEAVAARFDRTTRARAVECVHAPTPAVRARLDRLVEEGGFFVTTGQQPGLFTGPLYSVYKALTAVRLAGALEDVLGRPVIPLFWVASEDHDWREVDHTWTVSVSNELRRVALDNGSERGDRPVHRVPMGGAIKPVLEEFLSLFPDNDFKPACARRLRSAYAPGNSLGEAFSQVLADWLGPLGMAFVDASSLPLKRASRQLFTAVLDGAAEQEALLGKTAERLQAAGYHVQVPILDGGVNLFFEGSSGRERVYRSGSDFRLRHSGELLARRRILAESHADPRVLSPNVLLRPVVEGAVFPVVSYVAGPGEIAYFAQLRDLFDLCGIRMPVIHPRFSVTVVEPKIRKVLDKLDLSLQDLARPFGELAGRVVQDDVPDGVRQALADLRGGIGRGVEELSRAAATLDPTLKGPAKHVRTVAFDALEQMRKKIIHSLKREKQTKLRQLEKAQVHLYPRGGPQERSLNACYYLMRYGREFLDALHDRFPVRLAGDESRAANIAGVGSLRA
ncbi:MAG: bacillithiol biosynthesis cysteine-adding enzyme BshC [Gammaproteobacteria bacterium]|nr:bacillithiol biosynthesis cysteine-adding enzyme BshC [Gammaproteobacteria bacterium]